MDVNDINKELEGIKLSKKQPGKVTDFSVNHSGAKVILSRFLALLLLGIIFGFSVLVLVHFKNDANMTRMALVIVLYLALGSLLAYKLWNLTYIGWLFSLSLALAGIFLSALTIANRGYMMPALAVMVISVLASVAFWWVKDLFGVKRMKDIFKP
ncbi:MAG TPA: hypothetical protein VGK13_04000 [Methanocellaceae archaeon]